MQMVDLQRITNLIYARAGSSMRPNEEIMKLWKNCEPPNINISPLLLARPQPFLFWEKCVDWFEETLEMHSGDNSNKSNQTVCWFETLHELLMVSITTLFCQIANGCHDVSVIIIIIVIVIVQLSVSWNQLWNVSLLPSKLPSLLIFKYSSGK